MRVQVTFRINTVTGEVEVFQVDDMGQSRRVEDHDALHEDIARAIAEVIDPRADVEEMLPAAGGPQAGPQVVTEPDAQTSRQRLEEGGTG
jgi:hypothetical protein